MSEKEEREKFEYKLALFVFILTIIGSSISGYIVYRLTNTESPLITISPINYNSSSDNVILRFNNFRDTPANLISIDYSISSLSIKGREAGTINELYKGSEDYSFKFSLIRNAIAYATENYLEEHNKDKPAGYTIKVLAEDSIPEIVSGENRDYGFAPEYYQIKLSAKCENCKSGDIIVNQNSFNYWADFICVKSIGGKEYFTCKSFNEHIYITTW